MSGVGFRALRGPATTFSSTDLVVAALVAIGVQVVLGVMVARSTPPTALADISDERARPISVSITPVVDENAPLLKLGGKRKPGELPSRWQRPVPVARTAAQAFPSPSAGKTPDAIPSVPVADAGQVPPAPDAEVAKQVDTPLLPSDAAPSPGTATGPGSPDGVKEGTETDPLKARAVDLYRAQLSAWFNARFHIRGKVPFERLKDLKSRATVQVTADRRVGSFTVGSPSGDATFDEEVQKTLSGIQSSGAELPPPPPMYPDILGKPVPLSFSCNIKATCE